MTFLVPVIMRRRGRLFVTYHLMWLFSAWQAGSEGKVTDGELNTILQPPFVVLVFVVCGKLLSTSRCWLADK